MRFVLFSTVLVASLSACDGGASNQASDSGPSLIDRLKSGDTTVCADPDVQETMMSVAAGSDIFNKFKAMGKDLPKVSVVSATDINEKIHEISCSANVDVPEVGFLLPGSSGSVAWKVRPALDQDTFVVEIPAAGLSDTVSALRRYMTYTVTFAQSQEDQKQTETEDTTASEMSASPDEANYDNDPRVNAWRALEERCRGPEGGEDPTICDSRDEAQRDLERQGLCYGKQGQAEAEYHWHDCGSDSLRMEN